MSSTSTFAAFVILSTAFLLLAYAIYYPPKRLFDFMQRRHPNVLYHLPLPPSMRVVALTIDDSPSEHTSTILDSLSRRSARATFFIIGDQIPGHEPLLERMIKEGHEVGNHAWSDEKSVLRSLPVLKAQIHAVDSLLPANANGLKYFRPGGGFYSSGMVKMMTELGYRVVLGCVYPHDPQVWSPAVNAKHVLSMVRPGAIIILHDRRAHSAPQLELVLAGLEEGGWEVVSLGGLIKIHGEVNSRGTHE